MPVPDQVRDDGSGIQDILKVLDSAKASLRARLPDRVRHKLRRNDRKTEKRTFYETIMFEILNFGYWDLFGIWCLGFGI
jgi:hypothetical protein